MINLVLTSKPTKQLTTCIWCTLPKSFIAFGYNVI